MKEEKTKFTFKKEEKLKKRKVIDLLFKKGKSFPQYPLRWVYLKVPPEEEQKMPVQMGFSVSKKRFKKAVNRNRIKRLLREAWRLNKHKLYKQMAESGSYSVMIIYTSKEEMKFEDLEKKMKKSIKRFIKQEIDQ